MFQSIRVWWQKTDITTAIFLCFTSVLLITGALRAIFWIYDDRVRVYNETSPVIRCEVESDGDNFKIYAVKRNYRYKIASDIKEADLAHKKALLCDPGSSPQVAY